MAVERQKKTHAAQTHHNSSNLGTFWVRSGDSFIRSEIGQVTSFSSFATRQHPAGSPMWTSGGQWKSRPTRGTPNLPVCWLDEEWRAEFSCQPIKGQCRHRTLCRLSSIYFSDGDFHASCTLHILPLLKKERKCNLQNNSYFNPISLQILSKCIYKSTYFFNTSRFLNTGGHA